MAATDSVIKTAVVETTQNANGTENGDIQIWTGIENSAEKQTTDILQNTEESQSKEETSNANEIQDVKESPNSKPEKVKGTFSCILKKYFYAHPAGYFLNLFKLWASFEGNIVLN